MADPAEVLGRVRAHCLALPASRETTTFGNPTFQAGTKTFGVFDRYRGRRCLCFKASFAEQCRLCREQRFFPAPRRDAGSRGGRLRRRKRRPERARS